jgi:predicted transcriptional regulator
MYCARLRGNTGEDWLGPEQSPKEAVTVRLEPRKRAELDEVARALDRDRSYVITAAIDAYLEVHRWQVEHIRDGLREAEAGAFASDDEVAGAYARWRE